MRLALALLFSLTAATEANAQAAVATVEVTPRTATLVAGKTLQLSATARDANGAAIPGAQLIWLSGPFEIASVDQKGLVSGFRQGSLKVIVRAGAKTGVAEIEIRPKPAVTVRVEAEPARLVPGGTVLVVATPLTEDEEPIRNLPSTFRSSDPGVATIDSAGLVIARKVGTTTISATAGDATGSVSIEVVPNPAARLEVSGPTSARTGDVVRFAVKAVDRDGRAVSAPVQWLVSPAGATVHPDGGFVAERPGSYVIHAIVGTSAANTSISVRQRTHARALEQVTTRTYSELQAAEVWAIGDALYVSTIADRVYAYDIRDPANPVLTDSVMVDARIINDVSTTADGKIGVITREGASSRKNGIVFLDLADPLHPKVLSEYTATVSAGVHSAFIDGHYVYLTDDGARALKIIDFRDPRKPREVARWQMENRHTLEDPSGQTNGRYLHDVQVKDGLAYLAYFKDGAVILDVGNGIKGGSPEKPVFVSRYTYNTTDFYPDDRLAGTHTVFRYKNYLVIGDEVFPQFFDSNSREHIATLGRLHVLDVTDIENPRKVAEYSVPGQGSHNIWIEDDVLYVGNFEAGIRVVDVSGELRGDLYAQGREIGSVRAAASNGFRPNVPMTWGAQPHKGYIYASDMNSGLWVTKLTPKSLVP